MRKQLEGLIFQATSAYRRLASQLPGLVRRDFLQRYGAPLARNPMAILSGRVSHCMNFHLQLRCPNHPRLCWAVWVDFRCCCFVAAVNSKSGRCPAVLFALGNRFTLYVGAGTEWPSSAPARTP